MIPNNMFPKNTVHAIHLRAPSTSGGKDWVGFVTTNPMHGGKLWVLNGKTTDVMSGGGQGRSVKAPATEAALSAAVERKLDEGYSHVDEYEARCGWHNQPSSNPAQPSPQTAANQTVPPTPPAAKDPLKILDNQKGESGPTMCW